MKNIPKQTLSDHGFQVCQTVQTILDQAKPNEKHTKANLVRPWVSSLSNRAKPFKTKPNQMKNISKQTLVRPWV
jgi:hypothetical protein